MANPIAMMKTASIAKNKQPDFICNLICKAFTTRNLLHFSHWETGSLATHLAVGDLYDQIIDDIDEIVEVYMGKFGKVSGLSCDKAEVPKNIAQYVKSEAAWVDDNRTFISRGDKTIENLIDTLLGHYHKCVYKLENLS